MEVAGRETRPPPIQREICDLIRRMSRENPCLDHLIVLNDRHLYRILSDYFDYYHKARPHRSLDRNSPTPRRVRTAFRGPGCCHPTSRWTTPSVVAGDAIARDVPTHGAVLLKLQSGAE